MFYGNKGDSFRFSFWRRCVPWGLFVAVGAVLVLLAVVPEAGAQKMKPGGGSIDQSTGGQPSSPAVNPGASAGGIGSSSFHTVDMCEAMEWASRRGYEFAIYRENQKKKEKKKLSKNKPISRLVLLNDDVGRRTNEIGHLECLSPGRKKVRLDNWTKRPAEWINYYLFGVPGETAKLADGWTLINVKVSSSSDSFDWEIEASKGSSNPAFAIRVKPLTARDNRSSSAVEIEAIQLRGPRNGDWHQAFRDGRLGSKCFAASDCDSNVCDSESTRCVPEKRKGTWGSFCTRDDQCSSENGDCEENRCQVQLGGKCTKHKRCASKRCDKGAGSKKSKRCIPNDGTGNKGDFCNHNNQCKSSISCYIKKNATSGECRSKGSLGGSCNNNADCKSGACDLASQQCVPIAGTGNTNNFCTHDSHCKSNDCESKKCRAMPGIGESCANGRICASGRNCDATRKCVPKPGEGKEGQYCSNNNQCKSSISCFIKAGRSNGVCRAKGNLGAECNNNADCKSTACDLNKQRCVPLNGTGGTGDYCTQNAHCRSDSCSSRKCKARVGLGKSCKTNANCSSKVCDMGPCGKRCIPDADKGTYNNYCTHNHQCDSGNCQVNSAGCNGKCK